MAHACRIAGQQHQFRGDGMRADEEVRQRRGTRASTPAILEVGLAFLPWTIVMA
jgi:hypothetical protein